LKLHSHVSRRKPLVAAVFFSKVPAVQKRSLEYFFTAGKSVPICAKFFDPTIFDEYKYFKKENEEHKCKSCHARNFSNTNVLISMITTFFFINYEDTCLGVLHQLLEISE
jgi:hypothetical protein